LPEGVDWPVSHPASLRAEAIELLPMMSLTQLSNCLTLEGSFSSVSTATIAREGAFCSIFKALQGMNSFAPLRPEKFSKISEKSRTEVSQKLDS